ncbi:hypothetical protein PYCC9005_003572 [Savitreella phatthalungensis]
MSYSEDQLRKVLSEIEAKAITSQRDIGLVKQSIATKQRESRMLDLSTNELSLLEVGTPMYEGIGKAFVLTPEVDVRRRLLDERKNLEDDVNSLSKKLAYLETTFENAKSHIEGIVGPQQR